MIGNEKWSDLCKKEKQWRKDHNIKGECKISASCMKTKEMLKRHSEWKKQRGLTGFLRANSVV